MQLPSIHRLNFVAMACLVGGLMSIFLALPCGMFSVTWAEVLFTLGWIAAIISLLLSFFIDRVKCPHCGKPFNRSRQSNWIARNLSMTQPRRTCAHCGHGAKEG